MPIPNPSAVRTKSVEITEKKSQRRSGDLTIVAHLFDADGLERACEILGGQNPSDLVHTLDPFVIRPLWRYIETIPDPIAVVFRVVSAHKEAAIELATEAESVLRYLKTGQTSKAQLLHASLWKKSQRFMLRGTASNVYDALPKQKAQRSQAGAKGGKASKRTPLRKLLVDALRTYRKNHPGTLHDAMLSLKKFAI